MSLNHPLCIDTHMPNFRERTCDKGKVYKYDIQANVHISGMLYPLVERRSGSRAKRLWNSPRGRAEAFKGGMRPHEYADIASRSLRSRRGHLRDKILKLRRGARRSVRARRASEEGAVARANGPGRWPRDRAGMLDGGFGPLMIIDIASRSLRSRRGRRSGQIFKLRRDARRLGAGARRCAHESSVGGLEYQRRVFGGFGARKCVRQGPHTAGQLLRRRWRRGSTTTLCELSLKWSSKVYWSSAIVWEVAGQPLPPKQAGII